MYSEGAAVAEAEILPIHESEQTDAGFAQARGNRRPSDWLNRAAELTAILENHRGRAHRPWRRKVEEAMAQSDFGTLFTDVLDRQVLARYQAIPKQMRQMMKIGSPTSLTRTVNRHQGAGLTGELHEVNPGDEYQEDQKTQRAFTYIPRKFGRRVKMNWEVWMDDLGVGFFADIAQSLAEAAANTEERRLTELFFDANGPIDAYFADGTHGQGGVDTGSALSSAQVELAMAQMAGQIAGFRSPVDINNQQTPILNRPEWVVVPPVLEVTMRGILRSAELGAQGNATNTVNQAMLSQIANGIKIIVNPWIPVIVTAGSLASTTWAMFSGTIKPGELGLLQGHETPMITVKDTNHRMAGTGAEVAFEMGDFDTDSMQWRIRWVQGETTLDERGGWASDGV